ncbi:MAG: zinc-binding dehydrogenase, partial [Actinomycetota bacterium]|nr:zinc-binding dehydrogenase [Actinomycetota bacterium]
MKQVLQDRKGLTVVRDVPAPACAPGSVLVRTAYSAISSGTERSRVELSQKSLVGKARERPDLVREVVDRARREGLKKTVDTVQRKLADETAVGYSCAGRVVEVGGAVADVVPGDLVACAGAGHANHAAVVSVPANLCARVPGDVPLSAAALTTIAAIALHGLRLADVSLGDRVAVIGCGLVGQIACRLLSSAGAEVFALDIDARRAAAAGADHALGVDEAARESVARATGGVGVDRVLVTAASSTSEPLVLGAQLARDRGTVVLVGDVKVDVPRAPFYMKELSFRISRSYGPGRYDAEYEERGLDYPVGYVRWTEKRNMAAILSLQARGRLRLEDLVEETFPVSRAEEAYARLMGPPEQRPRGAVLLSYADEDGAAPVGAPARPTA